MSIIARTAAKAFAAGNRFSRCHTVCDGPSLVFHGTEIALRRGDNIYLTPRGFGTQSTFVRLNAVIAALGGAGHFHRAKGEIIFSHPPSGATWVIGPRDAVVIRLGLALPIIYREWIKEED